MNILNEWDPLGVLPFDGGPQDEYDWFSEKIEQKLKENISIGDLEKYIETQVTDYFGLILNDILKTNIKKYSAIIYESKFN